MTLIIEELKKQFALFSTTQHLPLYYFATIPSTNQKIWELLDGHSPPLLAIASRQTAGRGQWGKQWLSDDGGLYFSVGLATKLVAINSHHLTIATAWGIVNNLRNYHLPIFIKWPNDLILLGKKVGGIKTETRLREGFIDRAVIGVGINWNNHVPETGITLQNFCQNSQQLEINSLEKLAAIAVDGLLSGYARYLSKGINSLLFDYLQLWETKGRKIMINGSPGIVVGINEEGKLKVRLEAVNQRKEILLEPGEIKLGYDN